MSFSAQPIPEVRVISARGLAQFGDDQTGIGSPSQRRPIRGVFAIRHLRQCPVVAVDSARSPAGLHLVGRAGVVLRALIPAARAAYPTLNYNSAAASIQSTVTRMPRMHSGGGKARENSA